MRFLASFSSLLVCFACVLACGGDTDSSTSSRELDDLSEQGGMGGGQDAPFQPVTCADGVPLVQAIDWAEVISKPATAIEVVWTGDAYGVLWLASERTTGARPLHFVRVSNTGQVLGEPVVVGQAVGASHRIAFTGSRFIVAWINGRTESDPYDGVRLRVISAMGALAENVNQIEGTFDTKNLSLQWSSFAGGLVSYTKGGSGEGGLFVATVNEDGSVNLSADQQPLENRAVSAFASTYGDGAWALAYAVRDAALDNPILLHLLDDEGTPYEPQPLEIAKSPLGNLHINFGQGNYAITWSAFDEEGKLQPATVLLDGAAEVIGRPEFSIEAEFGVVEDVLEVTAHGFILSWNGELAGRSVLGIQVMSALGILDDAILMEGTAGATLSQARLVLGDADQVQVFSTYDRNPSAIGYSNDVSLYRTELRGCD